MSDNRHALISEFPEEKDIIHKLKISNNHFAKLYEEYQEIDKEIHRIESEVTPGSDEYLEGLKKKRLVHKDELFHLINEEKK